MVAWRDKHGGQTWPKTLIFFRDGASETQFQAVQMLEISQMSMACSEVGRCMKRGGGGGGGGGGGWPSWHMLHSAMLHYVAAKSQDTVS